MTTFLKMNGLGNDFVVVDARSEPFAPTPERVRALAGRTTGVGFDQLVVIEPAPGGESAFMRIRNADGGEVGACGNAARCVAALLLAATGSATVEIAAAGGRMTAWADGPGRIAVDMGEARFDAASIPLAPGAGDPLALTFAEPEFAAYGPAACSSVGNPHAVFFVADVARVPLEEVGPRLERHAVFPERANISFVTVAAPDRVRARVYERGVGPTLACGTAACAIAAVGHRIGRLARTVDVTLPGGTLRIDLAGDRLVMSGPWQLDWRGELVGDGFSRAG